MSETEDRRPRTDVERIEEALDALHRVAMQPGPDTPTQILNAIVAMKATLTPTEDEA